MTPVSFDVLIVGGGPAGSTLARALVAAGLRVAVFDRAAFPRDKPCAGWITPPVVDLAGIDRDAYAQGHVWQPVTGFRVGFIDGPSIEVRYHRPVSFGIRRVEFDWYLLERTGATLRLGAPVGPIERRGEWWVVGDGARAPLLVGAGGHFCPVARRLHPDTRRSALVVAQEIEFVMSARQEAVCRIDPDVPALWFCGDLRGYGWAFRKGRVLNVGLGREDATDFRRHARAFVAWLRRDGRVPEALVDRWPGHAYLLYRSSPRHPAHDGAVLVGDALGLADDGSGEGIRPAVESALLAAETILAAGGRYDRDSLQPYAEAIETRFGAASLARRAASWVPERLRRGLARRLLLRPWFARTVLLDRMFLHANEPVLPARAAAQT